MTKNQSKAIEQRINEAVKGIQINMRDMTKVWNFANDGINANWDDQRLHEQIARYVAALNEVR